MQPLVSLGLAALVGLQAAYIATWRHYSTRIEQLRRELEWERSRR
ncbi:hypothetical protein AB5J62_43815 [Amycolatopsis sp. cg5]